MMRTKNNTDQDGKRASKRRFCNGPLRRYAFFWLLGLVLTIGTSHALDHIESYSRTFEQNNDDPPKISETIAVQNDHYLGCYFDKGLCNDIEFCYDDSLLGQCLPKENPQQYLREIPALTEDEKELFSLELEKLTSGGFAWTDVFTQCILQNLLNYFQFGLPFDNESCALFLDDPTNANDENQGGNDEETAGEILPQNADEESNSITNVVPKKMIIRETFVDEASNPNTKYLQENENILIDPNTRELLDDYDGQDDEGLSEQQQQQLDSDLSGEFINPSEFQNYGLPEIVTENDMDNEMNEGIIPYVGNGDEFQPQFDFEMPLEELRPQEEVIWPNDYNDEDDELDAANVITSDVRKIKRNYPYQPQYELEYSSENLPPYFYPTQPLDNFQQDQEQDEEQKQQQQLQQDYEDELLIDPNSNVISRLGLEGGLGSRIFNRNERLDVKKPGPFFKNSANNFFIDKLAQKGDNLNQDYLDSNENDTEAKNMGQVEYEMPLLAPVKDKKNLVLKQHTQEENEPKKDTVHIALKNRLNTYNQGTAFIKFLANEFNLPQHALSQKLIENQHVQFQVDPNPQNIDAIQMAKRIDQDSELHAKIGDQIGVEIEKALPGHRDDLTSNLFSPGFANFNLLLLVVVAASTMAALLVVAVILLLIKRRRRILRKQGLLQNGQDDSSQEEYKQLCRDWSKSSKKVESSNNPAHKKVQNQDSKESQRSSTSSWPEEPSTTNMDISTGHMVLSYMEDHLKNKQRLEQEWVSLCGYEAEPCATTIAFKAENKKKNRYPDKLPYDHNRVILNAMVNASSSDYINASTITDHDPRNPSYIVTQAPLSTTVADFWQMIWEQGCVVIVMLTKLQDNGHQLCNRYWPEEGSEQYHIFEVHLVSEHVWCDDYLVRSVYLKNTRTGETRTVTQFHFSSWPAHGVPTSTKALLEFRRKVNKSYRGRSCPICIHCSDGVGRSGTYVLLDMVLNRMSKGCKEIDIAAALEHIRDQRGGMVQTRQQFEFCLMAVAEEVHAILKALPQ